MRWPGPGKRAEPPGPDDLGPAAGLRRDLRVRLRGSSAWVLAAALLAAACAKEEPPPGTLPDNAPPQIREVVPADGVVVPGFDGELKIRFDEPIERRRGLARELVSSPAYRYEVSFGFSEIRVRPSDGWREGVVYHFRFPGEVSDLLNNRRTEPLDLTFSTGPPLGDTRVEGRILDGVDRRPAEGARVLFLSRDGDSIPYTAVADTGGAFRFRALPPGRYRAFGFRDQNGDRDLDRRLEPWDSAGFVLSDSDASSELELSLLPPDTTPPRLESAEGRDSTLVELTFDDHLDPARELETGDVSLADTAGDRVPVAAVGLTRASVGLEPAPGTGPERPGRGEGVEAGGADRRAEPAAGDAAERADTLPLPSRTVLVRAARALRDSAPYRVRAEGFRNLRGLTGGGEATFLFTLPRDTARAEPGGEGDARGDSVAAEDTLSRPPPPDTAPGRPPSTRVPEGGGSGWSPREAWR